MSEQGDSLEQRFVFGGCGGRGTVREFAGKMCRKQGQCCRRGADARAGSRSDRIARGGAGQSDRCGSFGAAVLGLRAEARSECCGGSDQGACTHAWTGAAEPSIVVGSLALCGKRRGRKRAGIGSAVRAPRRLSLALRRGGGGLSPFSPPFGGPPPALWAPVA